MIDRILFRFPLNLELSVAALAAAQTYAEQRKAEKTWDGKVIPFEIEAQMPPPVRDVLGSDLETFGVKLVDAPVGAYSLRFEFDGHRAWNLALVTHRSAATTFAMMLGVGSRDSPSLQKLEESLPTFEPVEVVELTGREPLTPDTLGQVHAARLVIGPQSAITYIAHTWKKEVWELASPSPQNPNWLAKWGHGYRLFDSVGAFQAAVRERKQHG